MKTFVIAVMAILVGQSAISNDRTVSVSQMAQMCRSAEDYCNAYMQGLAEMMQTNCQWDGPNELSIGWFPSLEAGRSAFLLWAANNPDQSNVPAFHGVVTSFQDAFPCK